MLTFNGFLSLLVLEGKKKHLELLTAGHSHISDPLHSADDGISNHDSLSKHLFCDHCEEIPATAYRYRSHSQHKNENVMYCLSLSAASRPYVISTMFLLRKSDSSNQGSLSSLCTVQALSGWMPV